MCVFLDHLAFKIPAKENCGKLVVFFFNLHFKYVVLSMLLDEDILYHS